MGFDVGVLGVWLPELLSQARAERDKREQADSTSINITLHSLEVGSSSAYMLWQEPASPETQVNRMANFDRAICSHCGTVCA